MTAVEEVFRNHICLDEICGYLPYPDLFNLRGAQKGINVLVSKYLRKRRIVSRVFSGSHVCFDVQNFAQYLKPPQPHMYNGLDISIPQHEVHVDLDNDILEILKRMDVKALKVRWYHNHFGRCPVEGLLSILMSDSPSLEWIVITDWPTGKRIESCDHPNLKRFSYPTTALDQMFVFPAVVAGVLSGAPAIQEIGSVITPIDLQMLPRTMLSSVKIFSMDMNRRDWDNDLIDSTEALLKSGCALQSLVLHSVGSQNRDAVTALISRLVVYARNTLTSVHFKAVPPERFPEMTRVLFPAVTEVKLSFEPTEDDFLAISRMFPNLRSVTVRIDISWENVFRYWAGVRRITIENWICTGWEDLDSVFGGTTAEEWSFISLRGAKFLRDFNIVRPFPSLFNMENLEVIEFRCCPINTFQLTPVPGELLFTETFLQTTKQLMPQLRIKIRVPKWTTEYFEHLGKFCEIENI